MKRNDQLRLQYYKIDHKKKYLKIMYKYSSVVITFSGHKGNTIYQNITILSCMTTSITYSVDS